MKENKQQSDGLIWITAGPQDSLRTAFDMPSACFEVEIQPIYADDTVIYIYAGSKQQAEVKLSWKLDGITTLLNI